MPVMRVYEGYAPLLSSGNTSLVSLQDFTVWKQNAPRRNADWTDSYTNRSQDGDNFLKLLAEPYRADIFSF